MSPEEVTSTAGKSSNQDIKTTDGDVPALPPGSQWDDAVPVEAWETVVIEWA